MDSTHSVRSTKAQFALAILLLLASACSTEPAGTADRYKTLTTPLITDLSTLTEGERADFNVICPIVMNSPARFDELSRPGLEQMVEEINNGDINPQRYNSSAQLAAARWLVSNNVIVDADRMMELVLAGSRNLCRSLNP